MAQKLTAFGSSVVGFGESGNGSTRSSFGQEHYACYDLGEMTDYSGLIAVLPNALKKESMRFDVLSVTDLETEYLEQNVMILRSHAYEVLNRTAERCPCRIAREQAALPFLKRHLSHLPALTRRYEPLKLLVSHLL
jgi:hypothetical protein